MKNLLLSGACLLSIAVASANAQEAEAASGADDDTIVVYGVRSAIEESNEIKREAENFVEAVTSEDIGVLPDISIAESLERVVGVTAVPDRGRASELIIRGLSPELTLTTFNGRELASEQANRSVALGLFPSEIIQQARVIKSPTADLVENGLAGTVELRTARPLERKRRLISGNVRAILTDMPDHDEKPTEGWRGAVTYIDQFANDQFGIAASVAYQDDVNLVQDVGTGAEAPPELAQQYDAGMPRGFGDIDGDGIVDFLPRVGLQNNEAIETERFGAVLGIQWKPSPTTDINFDGMFTSRTDDSLQLRLRSIVLPNPSAAFAEGSLVIDPGAIGTGETLAGDPVDGALVRAYELLDFGRFRNDSIARNFESDFTSLGLNIAHQVGAWTFSGDLAYSEAERTNEIIELTAFRQRVGFTYDDTGSIPMIFGHTAELVDPIIAGNPAQGWAPEVYVEADNRATDEIFAVRFGAERDLALGMFDQVSFGLRYFEREKVLRRDRDAVARNAVNRPFSATNDPDEDLAVFEAALREPPSENFLDGDSGIDGWFYIDPFAVQRLRGGSLDQGRDAGDFTRDTHDVTEDAIAGYTRLDFNSNWAGLPVRGNVGLRVVRTESTANLVTPSFSVTTNSNGEITALTIDPLTEETAQFEEFDNDYTNVLPSFNIVAQPTEDLQLRFAVAKAMTRPLYEDLGETLSIAGTEPGENIDEVVLIGRSGNPDLEPFEAWQYDLGVGWYPSKDFNITAGIWYKDVSNFIVNEAAEVVFTDTTGAAVPVTVNQPTNLDEDGYIAGIELGYFQNFRFLPGFLQHTGISANYSHLDTDIESSFTFTYTDGDGATPNGIGCEVPDPAASGRICANIAQPPDGFAEDAANAILFYDDGKLDLRLAARYKSDFPQQFLDFPRVGQERTQWDANVGYALNKNLRFVASVTNLTNEPIERTWQDPFNSGQAVGRQLYREFGRKVTVGFVGRL